MGGRSGGRALNGLPTYDDLDELVDVDPIKLRDVAWELRVEVADLRERAARARELCARSPLCLPEGSR